MDIIPIDPSAIAAVKLDAALPVNTAALTSLDQSNVATVDASIVQFSPLAQLLAVTARFQAQQVTQVAPGSVRFSVDQTLEQLAAATNNFVQAFNAFQISITSAPANPLESAFDTALLAALHEKNIQAGTATVRSFIGSMARLGIQFQEAGHPLTPNQFQFELTSLEAAYRANPALTSKILSNAFNALSAIETQLLKPPVTSGANDSLTTAELAAQINVDNAVTIAVTIAEANAVVAQASTPANTATAPTPAAPNNTGTNPALVPGSASAAGLPAASPSANSNAASPAELMGPVMIDPLIATAVAAYRLTENLAPTAVHPPAASTTNELTDVVAPGKVDSAGPDTQNDAGVNRR